MPELIALAQPHLGDDEIAAAVRVLRGGHVVQGAEVAAFETEFAPLVAGRHCIAVNNGTSALWLSLLALGVGPGDEVIVPSFTFAATAAAVRLVGARCVFADIDPCTFCLDPAAVAAAITPRTVAIIAVHLYGQPADLPTLTALADRHHIALVEDAAQAHAATCHGRPIGTSGLLAAFSFYPTKAITTIEGGMIVTGDAALADRLRLLRNVGMSRRYVHDIVGTNARLSDVFAAVGRVQLTRLAGFTRDRRANAARLTAALTGLDGITLPHPDPGHSYHQFTVRVRHHGGRDALAAALHRAGIGSGIYYPIPLHRSTAYRPRTPTLLPHTDHACTEVLSLPVHPGLRPRHVDAIAAAVSRQLQPTRVAA
jgi:perosamine synthetase